MKNRLVVFAAAVALVAGCSSQKPVGNNRDTMTKRQRDSVLGQSGLHGAQGISKAIRAADSVKSQTSELDSIKP